MEMSAVSILIVHYNCIDHLERCLQSIEECALPENSEIIVVDNGSRDPGAVSRACSRCGREVKAVINPVNLGLARAANQAAMLAGGGYLLNLNPDVEVQRDSVIELVRFLDDHPRAAIAFPKLFNPDGSIQLSCRTHYDLITVLLRRTPLGRVYGARVRNHLMADWDHGSVREIDWGLGAAFMVRREALTDRRLFDDRFFLYMEDVDLCLTLRRLGWSVYYAPASRMVHHHRRESGANPWSRANWEHMKSFVRFSFKHGLNTRHG
jgi:N-acetylglucosaminyl-diphospho-decaprenol L-rhamnosyltransferase